MFEEIVRLQNSNVLATCGVKPLIHRGTIAGIRLVDDLKTTVGLHVLANDVGGAIRRAIVDANDFNIGKSLVLGRIQTLSKIFFDVINRNQ